MISSDDLILLDTNIILQLARKNLIGQQIESDYKISEHHPKRSIISYVTVGEMYALTLKFGWSESKIASLNSLLDDLVIVDINEYDIVKNYAKINYFSEKIMKPARPIGQNDIWIAATATSLDAWLMTTDNDFDHLSPNFLKKISIDPKTGKTIIKKKVA